MKQETIDVLKNFAGINQGIIFREGDTIRTMSVMKNVFARAVVPDNFEKEFAVYDLNEFLSTLSLFQQPELSFKDDHIQMKSSGAKVKYFYSSPNVIVAPPEGKNINVEGDLSFNLTTDTFEQLLKAAAVMKLTELQISSDGLKAFNKSSVGNEYTVEVEEMKGDSPNKIMLIDNMKMLPRDYKVVVGERAAKFTSIDGDLEYVVAFEAE